MTLIKAGAYKCGVFLSICKYDISYPQGGCIVDVYVQVVLAHISPTHFTNYQFCYTLHIYGMHLCMCKCEIHNDSFYVAWHANDEAGKYADWW